MADYYTHHAVSFISNTRDADMSDARSRFLTAVPSRVDGSPRILDAGSGSGRDSLAFRILGYDVTAFDGSPAMVAATHSYAVVPTRLMLFEDFNWEHAFEGIWACASLLHVAQAELPCVIDRLAAHLVPGGALYLSFKCGTGERMKDGRRFTDMTIDSLITLLEESGVFGAADAWESSDCRPERLSETWVNAVVNKA